MAFTFTLKKANVVGDQRMVMYKVSGDAVLSGAIQTPLGLVDCAFISPISMTAFGGAVKINTTTGSAAANGAVFISTTVNGDDFFLVVYGRS